MQILERKDIVPLECYKYILLTGEKHSGKKCIAYSYATKYYNEHNLVKEDVQIEHNAYIYALSCPCLFSISYIDVFCNTQILFEFIFKRLNSDSIFYHRESTFICTDMQSCSKKWQVYLYKLTEVYPDVKVILSTESISYIHEGIKNRFVTISVSNIGLFQKPSINVNIDDIKEEISCRNLVHSLIINLIDPKEVLKVITTTLLEKSKIRNSSKNINYVLQQSTQCNLNLQNSNEFYSHFCLEMFLLKVLKTCDLL